MLTKSLQSAIDSPIVSKLLLISPFFFWGTAMVAMKGVIPDTTPSPRPRWNFGPDGGRDRPKISTENLAGLGLDCGFCPRGWFDVSRLSRTGVATDRRGSRLGDD